MNKYKVTFKFTNAWFSQHCFNDEIESELDIKVFTKKLQKSLVNKNEPFKILKVINKIEETLTKQGEIK